MTSDKKIGKNSILMVILYPLNCQSKKNVAVLRFFPGLSCSVLTKAKKCACEKS